LEKSPFAGLVQGAARLPAYVEHRRVHDEGLRQARAARRVQGRPFWDASALRYDRAVGAVEQAMRQAEADAVQRAERDCAVLRVELELLGDRAAAARLRGLSRESERLEVLADGVRVSIAARVELCGAEVVQVEAARAQFDAQRVERKGLKAFRARMAESKLQLREERREEWELAQLDRELSTPGGWARATARQAADRKMRYG
jgi:hypothetical protein